MTLGERVGRGGGEREMGDICNISINNKNIFKNR